MVNLSCDTACIFKVAIPSPLNRLFDYLPPIGLDYQHIQLGCRLQVPFGNSHKIGYLVAISQSSDVPVDKLKAVTQILDQQSLLSPQDLQLLHWASHYYHHPIGQVIATAFPVSLRQGKIAQRQQQKIYGLTDLGREIDTETLRRAPKQKALLAWFKAHGNTPETILSLKDANVKATIKQLLSKQLLALKPSEDLTPVHNAVPDWPCNAQQQQAISTVVARLSAFQVFLLEGVTGSGKTEVYMRIISEVLARGQQVLVLVPEITLTPQLEERFFSRFAVAISVSHSRLTDNQRQEAWLQMQQGVCSIMLGTRSALFTPFKNLGLIILDEEHDASFKQQEGFRFSARDVAVVRGKLQGIPVLLGSATPSLESLYNVQKQRYQWLHLPERAGNASAPSLQLLDIRNKKMQQGLSEQLLAEIRQTLAKQEQVLLFLNRRGFAPTLICHSCAWVARCPRCDANLVIHAQQRQLRCHHCAAEQSLPSRCPACQDVQLTALGLGTERVEQVLARLFTGKSIIRLDRDSTQRKGSLENYLAQINSGAADIILGTQMLAKGHHFANVTLVAILDVDSGLFSVDFHAAEKLAQLVVQVAGRAGREEKLGKVLMQTRKPDHPLLTTLIQEGYQRFAEIALAERKEAQLPPYSYQALLRAQANDADVVYVFLQQLAELLRAHVKVQILGPIPAPMAKRAGLFRYQLLFQARQRPVLHDLLEDMLAQIASMKQAKKVRWSLDVDPVDLY